MPPMPLPYLPSPTSPLIVSGLAFGSLGILWNDPPASAAYDLTRSGAGDSSIMPPNPLPYIDTGGTPKDFHANVEDIANTKVSRDLAAFRPEHEPEFHNCGRDRPNKVIRAIDISRTYVVKAIRYLRTQGPKPEYIHWFGEPDADRASDVEKVFVNIRNNNPMGYTYDCNCNNENLYTWVGTCIFRSWNHHSVANEFLEQILVNSEGYISALASGISPRGVAFPRP